MNKKKSIIALAILVGIAVIFGFILVNRGDGPIMGMILSTKSVENEQEYKEIETAKNDGVYLVTSMESNKYVEKYKKDIPQNKDLYANIYLAECRQGSKFIIKWVYKNNVIKEEEKALGTDQKGVVSYRLEESKVKEGSYTIEIYFESKKIFTQNFNAK